MIRNSFVQECSERIQRIWDHPLYREAYQLLQELEKDRIYCGHHVEHFLDVARLMWIFNLENRTGIPHDLIYAAALLHDIGRSRQYLENIPHEIASADLAAEILPACGFTGEETSCIRSAILEHRDPEIREEQSLRGYLFLADKQSRSCFACRAIDTCNWPQERLNMRIRY